MSNQDKIKVLIVDDSAVIREMFLRILSSDPQIEVVGSAPDAFSAREKILDLKPDVITLDIEMPKMDGITFLKRLMEYHPKPVIIVSAFTSRGSELALEAIENGAIEVMSKPGAAYALNEVADELISKVKIAAKAQIRKIIPSVKTHKALKSAENLASAGAKKNVELIAIGASTGGVHALQVVLEQLPAYTPGIVVVQHMPEQFTKSFANRLNDLCAMKVKEAEDGDKIVQGQVLIAPGNYHMLVAKGATGNSVVIKKGPLVSGHRPSVDILFKSVSQNFGRNAVGVILTGMGADGAEGLKLMRGQGSKTIAQDEASCVVYGMPKEAVLRGGVEFVFSLDHISGKIIELIS